MALSVALRSASRLPALVNASKLSCVTSYQAPLLINKQQINNVRPISVTPIRQSASGSHVALWQAERALSVGLLGIVPIALIAPSAPTEYLLAASIVIHSHWGLEAIVTDYVRESLFGPVIPKAAHGLLLLFSAATLAGLCLMAHNGEGLAKTCRKLWKMESK